ncbi:DUF433 domain-containing protein [Niabella insulamsoli]|uniref:DUF433 domain-containing protein n=1 Tax=Niabella insulamsoli TaxID=3144874 RepID=UPI0031FD677E
MNQEQLLKRITTSPGVMSGKPVIRGLRFPVSDILELLASGLSQTENLEQHPILEGDDISAALIYASLKMKNTTIIHAA